MAVTLDLLKEQLANHLSKLVANQKAYVDKIRAYIEENYATKTEVNEQITELDTNIRAYIGAEVETLNTSIDTVRTYVETEVETSINTLRDETNTSIDTLRTDLENGLETLANQIANANLDS